MSLDRLLSRLHLLAGTVVTRSVINPLLWLTGVVTPTGVIGVILTEGLIRYLLFALAAVPIFGTIGAYCYFARLAPGRLQSEEYQLKQHVLENLGDDQYTATLLDLVDSRNESRGSRRQDALPHKSGEDG